MSATQARHLLAHETDRSNSSTPIFRNKDTKIYSLDNINFGYIHKLWDNLLSPFLP